MLKTLDNYITDEPSQDWLLEPVWRRIGHDRRITQIFATSAICHIFFYVMIIWLSWQAMRNQIAPTGHQPELVKLAELAPPADKMPRLRSQAEALERADTSRLQFDPNDTNDVNLTTRSPKPTTAKGVDTKLPSATQIENQIRASHGTADTGEPTTSPAPVRPPETAPVTTPRTPPADPAVAASGLPTPTTPMPTAPKPAGSATINNASSGAPAGKPYGDSAASAALGLQAAQAQYMAYVRTKIRTKNEQIMPRYYIETLLANTVSTDFRIIIGRSGQILSTDLVRSCGYKQLDDVARQAIQLAKPFEGYPPNAGDTITLTVTVYYTPGR
ncbi:MAG: TonB C-terminal domain-containing protein [Acidobacteria bacterium]|nr:TonB C-terminal domain-containing protein [Acidobacteriota bacterium]